MNFTARLKIELMCFLMISILTSLLDSSSGLNYLVNDLLLFAIFVVAAILLAKIFLNHHFFDIKGKITFNHLWRETNFQMKLALLGWVCLYYILILQGINAGLNVKDGMLGVIFTEIIGLLITFEGFYLLAKSFNMKRIPSKNTRHRTISSVFSLGSYNSKLLSVVSFFSLLVSFFAMGLIHPAMNSILLWSFSDIDYSFLLSWLVVFTVSFYIYIFLGVHLFIRKINSKIFASFDMKWLFLVSLLFYMFGLYLSWYFAMIGLDLVIFSDEKVMSIFNKQTLPIPFNSYYTAHFFHVYMLAFFYSLISAFVVKRYVLKHFIRKHTEIGGMRYFREISIVEKAKRIAKKIQLLFEKYMFASDSSANYPKDKLRPFFQKERNAFLYCRSYAYFEVISGSIYCFAWAWHIYDYYMNKKPIISTLFSFNEDIYLLIPVLIILTFGEEYRKIQLAYDFDFEMLIHKNLLKKYWDGLGLFIKLTIPWYIYSVVESGNYLLETYEQIEVTPFFQLLTLFIIELFFVLYSDRLDPVWDYVWSKIDNQYAMDSTIPNKKAVN